MGESTHKSKKQKVSATQYTSINTVCEDCGRKWTATLAEVPVTIFINDLDDYNKKLDKNLLEAMEPPMVLCVFRPSDREVWDTKITLSCVAPQQNTPYHWVINHKHKGPAADSGCQIIPLKDKNMKSEIVDTSSEEEIATIKEEINENNDVTIEDTTFEYIAVDHNIKPDVTEYTMVQDDPVTDSNLDMISYESSSYHQIQKRVRKIPNHHRDFYNTEEMYIGNETQQEQMVQEIEAEKYRRHRKSNNKSSQKSRQKRLQSIRDSERELDDLKQKNLCLNKEMESLNRQKSRCKACFSACGHPAITKIFQ